MSRADVGAERAGMCKPSSASEARDILFARTMRPCDESDSGYEKTYARWRTRGSVKPKAYARLVGEQAAKARPHFIVCLSIGFEHSTGRDLAGLVDFIMRTHPEGAGSIGFVRSDALQAVTWLTYHPESQEIEERIRRENEGMDPKSLDQAVFCALMEELLPRLTRLAIDAGDAWSDENQRLFELLLRAGVSVAAHPWSSIEINKSYQTVLASLRVLMKGSFLSEAVESDVGEVLATRGKYGIGPTVSPGVAKLIGREYLVQECAALVWLASNLPVGQIPSFCVYNGDWRNSVASLESIYPVAFSNMPLLAVFTRPTRSPAPQQVATYRKVCEKFPHYLLKDEAYSSVSIMHDELFGRSRRVSFGSSEDASMAASASTATMRGPSSGSSGEGFSLELREGILASAASRAGMFASSGGGGEGGGGSLDPAEKSASEPAAATPAAS